ncbi:hypothetical protein CTheo_2767 [Ceratobasidium theobromae]|uniref:Uncharacterized protein n=1 Tax=Ceratobasidium theobromae TaxID=1582974 RepID=A0A5N5QQA7_9AGAM|nr:hypothetical protein CTheo_2767 [Ceratobasidium theobromae]
MSTASTSAAEAATRRMRVVSVLFDDGFLQLEPGFGQRYMIEYGPDAWQWKVRSVHIFGRLGINSKGPRNPPRDPGQPRKPEYRLGEYNEWTIEFAQEHSVTGERRCVVVSPIFGVEGLDMFILSKSDGEVPEDPALKMVLGTTHLRLKDGVAYSHARLVQDLMYEPSLVEGAKGRDLTWLCSNLVKHLSEKGVLFLGEMNYHNDVSRRWPMSEWLTIKLVGDNFFKSIRYSTLCEDFVTLGC